jgi:hypothetical protein
MRAVRLQGLVSAHGFQGMGQQDGHASRRQSQGGDRMHGVSLTVPSPPLEFSPFQHQVAVRVAGVRSPLRQRNA